MKTKGADKAPFVQVKPARVPYLDITFEHRP